MKTRKVLRDTAQSFIETWTNESGESLRRKVEKDSAEYGNFCFLFHRRGIPLELGAELCMEYA